MSNYYIYLFFLKKFSLIKRHQLDIFDPQKNIQITEKLKICLAFK